jgi:hypothetical protein
MLNEIAWTHRSEGWGLSRKGSGEKCPSPAGDVACDVLHHRPSNHIVDVFVAAGQQATPTWNVLGVMTDASRPWVAPVAPGGSTGNAVAGDFVLEIFTSDDPLVEPLLGGAP